MFGIEDIIIAVLVMIAIILVIITLAAIFGEGWDG